MKTKITIIPFEESSKCNFYGIVIGTEECEMEKFSNKLIKDGKQADLQKIALLLGKIGENGAQERYFRLGGKYADHVVELPDHYILKSKYRLYCLRYGDSVVILGNGGLKRTRTYQEDPILNNYVETLQKVDREIEKLIKSGKLTIIDKDIIGTLEFYI